MATVVDKAVEAVVTAMRHSLSELLMEGQAATAHKHSEELEALAMRLEGRFNRSREAHDHMINQIRDEHLKFQSEIRSTVSRATTVKQPGVNTADPNLNHVGSSAVGPMGGGNRGGNEQLGFGRNTDMGFSGGFNGYGGGSRGWPSNWCCRVF